MIGHFPEPYPDELFYSLCARYSDRMPYLSKGAIIQDLFESRSNTASDIDLPGHLETFLTNLPPGHNYTFSQIVDNHTLLPFYRLFLSVERIERIQQQMRDGNTGSIGSLIGRSGHRIPLFQWLRFCPRCIEEDRRRFGECYWHRIHQIFGVEICPVHDTFVCQSNVRIRNQRDRQSFISAERGIQAISIASRVETFHDILLQIAGDIKWLFSQHNLHCDYIGLRIKYMSALSKLDLSTYAGKIHRDELQYRFKSHYPDGLLELLHCELVEDIRASWLLHLTYTRPRAQHPLRHLLFIHFLGYTAEEFFSLSNTEYSPFGSGPWPCLNPASNHYRQPVIQECHITPNKAVRGRPPMGLFSCTCGFVYSRTGPDSTANDTVRFNKVKSYGPVWENTLRMLWNDPTISLKKIAYTLGIRRVTVKHHAARIGLLFARSYKPLKSCHQPNRHTNNASIDRETRREMYRTVWISLIHEYPENGIKSLARKQSKVYGWLYQNDKAWLWTHRPPRQKTSLPGQGHVDWESRDRQLADEVTAGALRLKNSPGRPLRITINAVTRAIGKGSLIPKNLYRLPTTSQRLAEVVETREMFALRRIQWATTLYAEEDKLPTRYEIIKRAGIDRILGSSLVESALNAVLDSLRPRDAQRDYSKRAER